MNIEIPRPLAAEVLRLAEEADEIEGYTNERPKDRLTCLVDALRPRIQEAEWENRIECEKLDEAQGALGDPYYEHEDELRPLDSVDYEEADAAEEPDPAQSPAPANDEPIPF